MPDACLSPAEQTVKLLLASCCILARFRYCYGSQYQELVAQDMVFGFKSSRLHHITDTADITATATRAKQHLCAELSRTLYGPEAHVAAADQILLETIHCMRLTALNHA